MPRKTPTPKRGLAGASKDTRRRVASAGGKAVSKNRRHMAEIGRKGGKHSRRQPAQTREREAVAA